MTDRDDRGVAAAADAPDDVVPAHYPQLGALVWNRDPSVSLPGAEALAIYEAEWRHVDPDRLDERERRLIERLVERYGNGHFLEAR